MLLLLLLIFSVCVFVWSETKSKNLAKCRIKKSRTMKQKAAILMNITFFLFCCLTSSSVRFNEATGFLFGLILFLFLFQPKPLSLNIHVDILMFCRKFLSQRFHSCPIKTYDKLQNKIGRSCMCCVLLDFIFIVAVQMRVWCILCKQQKTIHTKKVRKNLQVHQKLKWN